MTSSDIPSDAQANWKLRSFDELDVAGLYGIIRLRNKVFIVEQQCAYQDLDGMDEYCLHLSATVNGKLAAYARIIPPGYKYGEAAIGRIVTAPWLRGKGWGKILVEKAIEICKDRYPERSVRISAQCYLHDFYASMGFEKVSDIYLEDGIDHQDMLLKN